VNNLIPKFILEKHAESKSHGSFKATTLFIDISGFTPMTQELMMNGKEGAEVVNNILNNIFEPVIDAVYDRGGFISTFAGDAFTAIFPDTKHPLDSCHAATAIRQIFKDIGKQETRFGVFELSVKIGLSFGRINWGIVGYQKHKTYFFRGPAIDNCAKAEHKCDKMQIAIHKNLFIYLFEDVKVDPINKTYCFLTDITKPESDYKPFTEPAFTEKAISQFIPKSVLEYKQKGEFRDVVNVFISFKEPSTFDGLDNFTGRFLKTTDRFGGYLEVLDFGDKGGNCLVIFGAPLSYEDNIQRAIGFINSLRKEFQAEVRAGVTFGTVFAGINGSEKRAVYGVIGGVVNLSARFMMKADWGQVLLDSKVQERVKSQYGTEAITPKRFKGFAGKVTAHLLLEPMRRSRTTFFDGTMVGREEELNRLTELLHPIKNGKFGGIVYVYGAPGTGKSRLIYELIRSQRIKTFTLQCDSILKQSLNPIAYFLHHYFNQSEARSIDDRKAIFEKRYFEFVSIVDEENTNELRRIESIIGSVVGLFWEGSIYDMIEPKERPVVIQFAIKEFITTLSRIEPVILTLEDIQWIDDASQEALQILTRQVEDTPFIILASSRFNDDGSNPVLETDEDVKCSDIILGELQPVSIQTLIESKLGQKANDELSNYIYSRTEGNPFYTEQFCLYLMENDLIKLQGEFYKLFGKPVDIPVGINMIVIARIDRLSAELKETMQVASVLGGEFEVNVLKELIDMLCKVESEKQHILDGREIHPIVTRIEGEKVWSNMTELIYIFSHALLRDAAYEMQLKARLRELHKLAGDTIVKAYPEDMDKLAEIAHHYELAEEWVKAGTYFLKAGEHFTEAVKFKEASISLKKALSISKNIYDPNDPIIAKCLHNLARLCKEQGLFFKSKALYEKEMKILERNYRVDHEKVAACSSELGVIFLKLGLFDNAEFFLKRALSILGKVLGTQHIYSANCMVNLALLCENQCHFEEAELLLKKSLKVKEKLLGVNPPEIAINLNNIANIYNHQGRNEEAEVLYERALEIYENQSRHEISGLVKTLNNLATIYQNQGFHEKAKPIHIRALKIKEKIYGKRHPSVALSLNNLANIYQLTSQFDKAEPLRLRALEILIQVLGKQHPTTAIVFTNLGFFYKQQGQFDKAIIYYKKGLKIKEKILSPEHLSVSNSLNGLAKCYLSKGIFNKAEELFIKTIEIIKKNSKENHPNLASALVNLGALHQNQSFFYQAEQEFIQAYKIQKRALRDLHPDTIYTLHHLAELRLVQGYYQKAERIYIRIIGMLEKTSLCDSDFENIIDNYVKLLKETDRPDEAKEMRERAQTIRDKSAKD